MIWMLLACLPDLSQRLENQDSGVPVDTGEVSDPDGAISQEVDATDYEAWVEVDLDQAQGPWELRFQRYVVELNPDTQVQALWLEGVDFDALSWADVPETGWAVDQSDQDGDGEPERVFDEWYLYDSSDHSLTPLDRVYLVRGPSGTFKLVFDDYYSEAGTPAKLQLRWQRLTSENAR